MPYNDPVKEKECQARYRAEHKQELRTYGQIYYLKNKEDFSEHSKQHYQENKQAYIDRANIRYIEHKEQILTNRKEYINRSKVRKNRWEYLNRYAKNIRVKCLTHYSDGMLACVCCGESNYEFLTIDHINGGGKEHKRKLGGGFYPWLIKNNYPSGFRTLCMSCNFAYGLFGYCPHKRNHSQLIREDGKGK